MLRFEGPALTLYTWPEVFREEGSYAYGEPEYRNWVCSLIGETVKACTLEEGLALEIEFESGVILRASLPGRGSGQPGGRGVLGDGSTERCDVRVLAERY